MLSPAIEDYLKTIYKLHRDGAVATTDIAKSLDVAAASVTAMVKRLAKMGLVSHESYRGVELTDAGRKVALEIIRHHRLLETYLRDVMGYSWQQLHDEAEQLEHHISEAFEDKLSEMLGHPTRDPHGHPIPSRDGEVADLSTQSLSESDPGAVVIVQHVSDEDPEMLHYLEDLGLLPGARVEVVSVGPFEGPIEVVVDGNSHTIGRHVAGSVFIDPTD